MVMHQLMMVIIGHGSLIVDNDLFIFATNSWRWCFGPWRYFVVYSVSSANFIHIGPTAPSNDCTLMDASRP